MVIAGLAAARGCTEIEEIQYTERGYGDIVEKLQSLGADYPAGNHSPTR
ncbi:MAG: hypothetical protein ACLU9S_09210 [Oscillospiraceae bacterium]